MILIFKTTTYTFKKHCILHLSYENIFNINRYVDIPKCLKDRKIWSRQGENQIPILQNFKEY